MVDPITCNVVVLVYSGGQEERMSQLWTVIKYKHYYLGIDCIRIIIRIIIVNNLSCDSLDNSLGF